MGTNLALRKLYVELGALQNQKSAMENMAFAGTADINSGIGPMGDDAESTGISTFRKISKALRGQLCGNSELTQAAQGAGLTQAKVKEVVAGIAASALGLGGAWPAIVAGIVVTLFFDKAAPLICQKWAKWNDDPGSDAYQSNPALSTKGG
ncbi:hypothetical protein [Ralstonia solanacearum]|uniref:hypothetical protein n=1 Tax=Ralstonia solanacearum TaxID=305 RepID=UPI0006DC722C|nr:hypothetical protein [Ralstonia solanacearum]